MAEAMSRGPEGETREAAYRRVGQEILSVVAGETSETARFASAACILAHAFAPRFFWTGFYQVDPLKPRELVVGPYQGTLGCLRIPFGRGVCGAAAESGETQLVEDVHAFPGHIACDSRSKSEIVVPVFRADGTLAAVLDGVWSRFGATAPDELDRLTSATAAYREARQRGLRAEIEHAALWWSFANADRTPDASKVVRPTMLRTQSGRPVVVRAWSPQPATTSPDAGAAPGGAPSP